VNIYDKAHELARVFKKSEEYRNLLAAQVRLSADSAAYKMFLDYRRKEIAYQTAMMSGQTPDDSELKNLERLAQIIGLNSAVRDYIQAEARLGVIFSDIQRIIGDSIKELSSMYTQDEEEGGNN